MEANPFLPGTLPQPDFPDLSNFRRSFDSGGDAGGNGSMLPPGEAPDREPSLLSRFLALFSSPRRAFVPPRGRSFWLVPMILTGLVQGTHTFLLTDLYTETQRAAIESSTQLSEEQRAQILEQLDETHAESGPKIVQTAIGMIAGVAFTLALPAALLMFGINFGVGGAVRFLDALGVLSLTSLIYAIREAILIPLKLSQNTVSIFTGPAAFLDKDAGILYHIATMLDLFDLYRLFLVVIGLSIVGNVSTGRSAAVVLAFWGLFVLIQIGVRLSPLGAFAP